MDRLITTPRLSGPVTEGELLAGWPPSPSVPAAAVARAVRASGRRLVVLDDDPTGTQSVAGVPVLTRWTVEELRWALTQDASAFYVLTNTRSLDAEAAATRLRQILRALAAAARLEQCSVVIASRGDSTLRGHFPLETDVIGDELAAAGGPVDGVVIAPAYIDAGRVTVDSVHWMRTATGYVPVDTTEFARDATFGFRSSDLRAYAVEKSLGRWSFDDVARITLHDLREGGVEAASAVLMRLRHGQPVVVDAATDGDLRVLSLALLAAEDAGVRLVYRVGPSFVRARAGQSASAPLSPTDVAALRNNDQPSAAHGLVVVGSHVGQSSAQLAHLLASTDVARMELDVTALLDEASREEAIAQTVRGTLDQLMDRDVAIVTSRTLITGADPEASLAIARAVSSALVDTVRRVVLDTTPAWIVAKGGITSSDIATEALGFRRAWARGTLLPGIVSLWQPVDGDAIGVPYAVFAGNVGGEAALTEVVGTLRKAMSC
jgi:uncharacterized protein YgbK (DUF1537 family)